MHITILRLINVFLRVLTGGTRFLLIFVLAKFFSPEDVGLYGLFAASIGLASYFVGLDFYVYSTREILKAKNCHKGHLLAMQLRVSIGLYLLFMPVIILLLYVQSWPSALFFGFIPILILEHLNQELYRLLIALSKQLTASILLFVRQGTWAIVFTMLIFFYDDFRSLNTIVTLWIISGVFAALAGFYCIYQMRFTGWSLPIDWVWVRKGLKISVLFLFATLALRGISTLDRYFIEFFANLEVVGAYVLFYGISGALLLFMDAGVFSFSYPKLIKLYQEKQIREAGDHIKILFVITLLFSAVFAIFCLVTLPYLLKWIDQSVYIENQFLFPWILAAVIVSVLSSVPHYALYAQGKDRDIFYSHLGAFITFSVSVCVLSFYLGVLSVPIALLLSFLVLLIWKTKVYIRTLA